MVKITTTICWMKTTMDPTGKMIGSNCETHTVAYHRLAHNRRIWTNEEDEAIRQMVMKYGTKSWALIAENLSKEHSIAGRSGKQCRERWHNHLGKLIPNVG